MKYHYRVRAVDAAGNLSGYSNIANVTLSASSVVAMDPTVSAVTSVAPPMITENLTFGDKNNDVILLKLALRQTGFMSFAGTPTNVFGSVTKEALKRFQEARDVSAKGVLTIQTRTLINSILSTMSVSSVGGVVSSGAPVFTIWLQREMTHPQVALLQKLLIQQGVYPEANISGYFGPLTEIALKRFQTKYSIATGGTPDTTGYGGTGPRTRAKLNELSGVVSGVGSPVTSVAGSGSSFIIGSVIYTTDRLFVRVEGKSAGTLLGAQAKGSKGSIVSGPVVADGHTWWKIAYIQGFTGWSSQAWLSTSPVTTTVVTTPTTVTPKPVATTPAPKPASLYTTATVSAHASASNCWSIIDGNVYNLTSWVSQHPGGASFITGLCGGDGSSAFHGYHGSKSSPASALAKFKLGALGS
jgi:peptidoglycan hydrolase-like protein with peptidoglycan-binding domain